MSFGPPLNAILGWSRILRDKPEPSKIEKGLPIIERNASAQAKLIEDILNVSQIIAGKVVLDLRRVQLSNIVQNAVDSIRPAAAAKRIRVDLTIEDASLDFIADEDRLQQVVSMKTTPEISLQLFLGKRSQRSRKLLLSLAHERAGIVREPRGRIRYRNALRRRILAHSAPPVRGTRCHKRHSRAGTYGLCAARGSGARLRRWVSRARRKTHRPLRPR